MAIIFCDFGMARTYWAETSEWNVMGSIRNKKYLLIGGYIISRYDGQRHHVSGHELRRLYGFSYREVETGKVRIANRPSYTMGNVGDARGLMRELDKGGTELEWQGWTVLRPREDGHYELFRWFHKEK